MEEKQSKSFKLFKIEYIPYLLFVISLLISILSFIINGKYNSLKVKETKIINTYNEVLNNEKINNTEIYNLKNEISIIENIEESITNIKNEYDKNAKILEDKVINNESNYKIMYLTFDDGPYETTPSFLDILKNNDITATFFVLMKYTRLDIYKSEAMDGHEFGNHTAYHNLKAGGLYKSTDEFMRQIDLVEKFLIENMKVKPSIARFPGGTSTAKSLKNSMIDALHNKGYKYVNWTASVGDGDGAAKTVDDAINLAKSTTKNKNVVVMLMHDYSSITLKALPTIIDNFKKDGYIFLPLFKSSSMLS